LIKVGKIRIKTGNRKQETGNPKPACWEAGNKRLKMLKANGRIRFGIGINMQNFYFFF